MRLQKDRRVSNNVQEFSEYGEMKHAVPIIVNASQQSAGIIRGIVPCRVVRQGKRHSLCSEKEVDQCCQTLCWSLLCKL